MRRKYKIFEREQPPQIPPEVAVCPICQAPLLIEDINHWERSGRVTEAGFHINCTSQPDYMEDPQKHFSWSLDHFATHYLDWPPIHKIVFQWFDERHRLKL